jgi:hypothetical protein
VLAPAARPVYTVNGIVVAILLDQLRKRRQC